MVFEFCYCTTEGKTRLDNSFVPHDEELMRMGHFLGYDNLVGENTFYNIHSHNLRESVISEKSHCTNRIRQLVVSLALFHQLAPETSLESILQQRYIGKRILLLEHQSYFASIVSFFCRKHGIELVTSEYFGDNYKSGELVKNVMHLNIEKTHFPAAYFDLILHTDVFEHVADAPAGEREIARILTAGGIAIFTAPFDFDADQDDVYAEIVNNTIRYNKEPIYHDDPIAPDGKCLVFRVFSFPGMKARFESFNCSFRCNYLHSRYLGIIGNNAYSFVAEKR